MQVCRSITLAAIAALAGLVPLNAQTTAAQITLSPVAAPSAGQAGVTSITLTGSGFPTAAILPANTDVKLEPPAGSTQPTVSTKATSIATVVGTTRRVTFLIPASIIVTAPAAWQLSISGTASDGTPFSSTNKASLTINPPARISLNLNTAQAGQNTSVNITGQFTDFVSGSTQANFGAGISVGGAPEGANGPITVTGTSAATASLTINASAAGSRDVTVQTGAQRATLAAGFTVTPAVTGPGTISAPSITPASIPYGAATSVTVSVTISGGTPDAGSVLLQRLDSSGRVLANLGTFQPSGNSFTLTTTLTEFATDPIPCEFPPHSAPRATSSHPL